MLTKEQITEARGLAVIESQDPVWVDASSTMIKSLRAYERMLALRERWQNVVQSSDSAYERAILLACVCAIEEALGGE
jgi:hypothetical protein